MILLPSLSTARDVISLAPGWRPNVMTRAAETLSTVGGKAVNVARFATGMGGSCHVVALADAELGRAVTTAFESQGVSLDLVPASQPSRIDVTILDGQGGATVVNAPGAAPSSDEIRQVRERILEKLGPGVVLVLAGSLPRTVPDDFYADLAAAARDAGAVTVLDTSARALAMGIRSSPDVVKVNASELAEACGSDAAMSFLDGRSVAPEPRNLAVTAGSAGLRAWLEDGTRWHVRPPRVDRVNPLGAGDAVTAGIAVALHEGRSLLDGLIRGTAWAAAKVERLDLGADASRARELLALVAVDQEG